jgi:hypothetical protein
LHICRPLCLSPLASLHYLPIRVSLNTHQCPVDFLPSIFHFLRHQRLSHHQIWTTILAGYRTRRIRVLPICHPHSSPSQTLSRQLCHLKCHLGQVSQQMWLPMPGMSQQMPSPLHHQHSPLQQSPYDLSFPMASPLSHTRSERSHSLQTSTSLSLSTGLPSPEQSPREAYHRADSPGHADLNLYGWMNPDGTWKCAYPGCTSRAVFTRGCDLRKHHKRHTKSFFCRYPGCTQSSGGGFSSKKDLARHEAKHNPGVVCEWSGCDRIFSRVDNMVCDPPLLSPTCGGAVILVGVLTFSLQRDHVKRIHLKAQRGAVTKVSRRFDLTA